MLCDRCHGREATVHMTQIINGQRTECHLCPACAAEMQVMKGAEDWMDRDWFRNPLEAFFGEFGRDSLLAGQPVQVESMRNPLFTEGLREPQDSYEAFREKIRSDFQKRKKEKTVEVKGKEIPVETNQPDTEKGRLEKDLKSCIAREDYERAAEIRDQIKKLAGK